ncbi:unnamed protein product [Staurois parvus]|uniref:Uncharacterized protein n=1 Tax=Staurois parvus TaxID=386267 RepID=A0ABN9DQ52_9NEOB|nr:unnamed protein product [Staurois parvus]
MDLSRRNFVMTEGLQGWQGWRWRRRPPVLTPQGEVHIPMPSQDSGGMLRVIWSMESPIWGGSAGV